MAAPQPVRQPRICMPTARKFTRRAYQCAHYEAQDVLQQIDDVDLICPEPGWRFQFSERWQVRLLYRDVSKKLISVNPGLHRVHLRQEYDLFILRCQTPFDLIYVNAIDGWRDHCKTSVCWIDEIWAADLPRYKYWLHALRNFDHVFLGCSGTVVPLSNAISRSCRWLPGAVDALRFTPYPNPSARVIDVYSLGLRWPGIHQALLEAAQRREVFYVYDTFPRLAEWEVHDHRQHRDLYASLAQRSRYFLVAPGKMDAPDETKGQVEIGHRYFEAAAAGSVMIGQQPDSQVFREIFPWSEVVVQIQPNGSDVMEVVSGLNSEPDRVSAISRRNTTEALLRHDWLYRWKEILRVAGLEPLPAMTAREKQLRELADLASNAIG